MNPKYLLCSMLIVVATAGSMTTWGDEAAGTVSGTSFGAFTLNENGVTRKFNLSAADSQYEPSAWRPTPGDAVKVTYTATPNRRGTTVLAVGKAVLVKAGPDTVTALGSPVTVVITEAGRTGVLGKLPKGQVTRFGYQRTTERLPVGWQPAVGDKAIIVFQAQAGRGFNRFDIDRLIERIEKVP